MSEREVVGRSLDRAAIASCARVGSRHQGCGWLASGAEAHVLAAEHAWQTGHAVRVTEERVTVYRAKDAS